MHHGVAIGDIDIELIGRFITEVLEILLYLHLDIVPRQIAAQQIAIAAEFVQDGRERERERERSAPTSMRVRNLDQTLFHNLV